MDIQHTFLCSLSIRLHLGVGPRGGGTLGQFAGAVGVNGCAFVFSFLTINAGETSRHVWSIFNVDIMLVKCTHKGM